MMTIMIIMMKSRRNEQKDKERAEKKKKKVIQSRNRMNKNKLNESACLSACTHGVTTWYRKTNTHKTHFIQTGEQSHEEMPTQTSVLNDNSLR